MKILNLLIISILICSCTDLSKEDNEFSIVPKPQTLDYRGGQLKIPLELTISDTSGNLSPMVEMAADILAQSSGLEVIPKKEGLIRLGIDPIQENPEGYHLEISGEGVSITGNDMPGLFYGIQSLAQILSPGRRMIPFARIEDAPAFKWRGMHLDVSRHFRDKDFILKFIDMLALHKLNIFHWHLVDDQGWRLEIKKYPDLTEVGAWREDRRGEVWSLDDDQRVTYPEDKALYGGFYTQNDVREIVQYAQERFITIVPEIEMPGHSRAALVSYPEVSCFGYETKVPSGGFVGEQWDFSDPFCAGKEETFEFLQDILDEVVRLFPSEYIHIGGDECSKRRWRECPNCQQRILEEGLENEEELQSYFIKRVEKHLNSKGRKIIGWQEILEGGMDPSAAIMPWRGSSALDICLEAAKGGHEVIMAPSDYLYFNPSLPLEVIYSYHPIPDGLHAEHHKHIIGVQACAWAEHLISDSITENVLVPRMAALSEIAWTQRSIRSWDDFQGRLQSLKASYRQMNINYFVPPPENISPKTVFTKASEVRMERPSEDLILRYTRDGKEPTIRSSVYEGPFELEETVLLKAAAFDSYGQRSEIVEAHFEHQSYRAASFPENLTQGLKYRSFKDRFKSALEIDQKPGPVQSGITSVIGPVFTNDDMDAGLVLEGYIAVPSEGIYTFYTASDDGSVLWIGSELVVDNDGFHGGIDREGNPVCRSGQIALSQGYHPIRINYFDWGGGELLKVFAEGPGLDYQEIPEEILFH